MVKYCPTVTTATALLVTTLLVGGCGSFADPAIVSDLRVLAITAEPPEQLLEFDIANPPTAQQLLAQLKPVEICALLHNPGDPRPLRWSLTVCGGDISDRCPADEPLLEVASGTLANPATTSPQSYKQKRNSHT